MIEFNVITGVPERWITQIQGGVITLVHRIPEDALVISLSELSAVILNNEFFDDELVADIELAIKSRV